VYQTNFERLIVSVNHVVVIARLLKLIAKYS